MLKRIACISTIEHPEGHEGYSEQVFGIFDSTRLFNKEHNIVGAFLVFKTILLQVLEGNSTEIAHVIYQLGRDPRISDVSIILNQEIGRPAFSRWSIRLLSENCDAHIEHLKKINAILDNNVNLSSTSDKIRYHKLFNTHSIQKPATPEYQDAIDAPTNFRGTMLSMPSWPRPTELRLDAALMRLCPLLIKKNIPYQRLVALNIFPQEQELVQRLTQLYQAHALEVIQIAQPDNLHYLAEHKIQEKPKSGRFSQALRNFISSQREKGISNHE